ncbi:JAB domain-containing protein [Tenacibaculum ovolyticum]|uniref:JAB domain-containing protein n=1 Tax=Tenacibaculum ovolyticum TaxID=104270 RepID=UPI0009EE118A|nr:JAB domain-containing protein [Tenacibaculum ovolyticum]
MIRMSNFKDFVGELTVNYRRTKLASVKITSSVDVADFMRNYFDDIMDNHEEVKVLHLNRNNQVVNVHHLSSGSDSSCIVPVKDVLRNALLIKVNGIVLVHNHPSGNLKPSKADIDISKKLKSACDLIDISFFDSIILTRESYYSLADNCDL